MAQTLSIGIVLDVVCPWCFVGKRRIEQAVALAQQRWPGLAVDIEYMPYQLDPAMGKGLDKEATYRAKFGDRLPAMHERLRLVGLAEGIQFKFGGRVSNTLDAHRLIDRARLLGGSSAEAAVVEALMHRYFELEQDIGDLDTLLAAAAAAGLDPSQACAYLQSDDGVEAVQAKIAHAARLGVTGVPFYIINDRYGVSGAESPETFLSAFEKAIGAPQAAPNE
ncbi:hypothetical protein H4R18_001236 [Coemansia javaensis]|uniref:DSBA-like thioredoxin domain-containing protein n=1 Tax=Coemansia javaensis TaxID=2761396 RepID=A0A9W8HFU4_9FUNG|nr:hypothetical protein H4R18_001236 [Coemansia javaensis]